MATDLKAFAEELAEAAVSISLHDSDTHEEGRVYEKQAIADKILPLLKRRYPDARAELQQVRARAIEECVQVVIQSSPIGGKEVLVKMLRSLLSTPETKA